jgi:hypothetical protein
MDILFLPRSFGSTESGPQTFAGTNVINTTFFFTKEIEQPGLLNSALVVNAGQVNLNGVFNYVTIFEGKPYYNKGGDSSLFIVWFNNQWQIYDFNENTIDPIYFSNQNVLYPWNVSNWTAFNTIYNPTPIVSKVL